MHLISGDVNDTCWNKFEYWTGLGQTQSAPYKRINQNLLDFIYLQMTLGVSKAGENVFLAVQLCFYSWMSLHKIKRRKPGPGCSFAQDTHHPH